MSRIVLSSPLTHSDWMLKKDGPEWGPVGVRQMLTRCKEFGFEKIFWRCYDGGRSTYHSRLIEPFKWIDHEEIYQFSPGYIPPPGAEILEKCESLDYYGFDSLKAAVEIGHELDLEIHGWMSLNEDDHGVGWPSRFTREHPECRWVRRNGERYHSQLSFAFLEVREYKLGLVREVLAYEVDGILLDWIRTGDIRDNPQADEQGNADFGYEKPNIDVFKKEYGLDPREVSADDPRWVAVCAEPVTAFMREFHRIVGSRKRKTSTAAMVQHPWAYRGILPEQITRDTPQWVVNMKGNRYAGALNGLFCDIKTWAREGLVDSLLASGYYVDGGTPEKAYDYMVEETEGRLPLTLYIWVPAEAADFERDLKIAEQLGTREMLFWEADYIDSRPVDKLEALEKSIHSYQGNVRMVDLPKLGGPI
ncbi:MAG: family 10 glycosylhydrolase [Gemmatimonadetes bacterium]|jgi:hypothetical protein|nr:family 10 glycosylhydrolase [Gemmatimonadota bacterium]